VGWLQCKGICDQTWVNYRYRCLMHYMPNSQVSLVLYSSPMKLHTAPLRWIAKFLLAAVLLQALAPAWAGANNTSTEPLLEICTTAGTQWIKQGIDNNDPPSIDHHAAHKHCVFCSSTGAADTFDASKLLVNHFSSEVPSRFTSLFVQLFSGHSILSRAPPL
jgi:hypothetical protein